MNRKLAVVVTIAIAIGIFTGSNNRASALGPCGLCNFSNPDVKNGFCDYTMGYGECGGNNGAQCGGVPCS